MVYDITRRSTYNHLSSWLTDARNLTNPNTVSCLVSFIVLFVRIVRSTVCLPFVYIHAKHDE